MVLIWMEKPAKPAVEDVSCAQIPILVEAVTPKSTIFWLTMLVIVMLQTTSLMTEQTVFVIKDTT